jgi:hypothetical protein
VSALAAENSGRNRGRVENLRPFKPGQSGNPGGRPKGLVSRIREQTRDGAEIADYMLGVFRDGEQPTKIRLEAAAWLADRGFGRAIQPTREEFVDVPEGVGLDDLSREELAALKAAALRKLGLGRSNG